MKKGFIAVFVLFFMAIEMFAASQESDKSHEKLKVLFMKGHSFFTEEKYRESISCFQKVLDIKPGHSESEQYIKLAKKKMHFKKGYKLFEKRKYRGSIIWFNKVLEIDPAHAESKKYIQRAEKKMPPVEKKQTVVSTEKEVATIVTMMGVLGVIPAGEKEIQGKEGMKLAAGYRLKTSKKASAAIETANGSVVKINAKTELDVEAADRINIILGEIFCKIEKGKKFEVKTPACVCAVRGTELNVKVKSNGETMVTVFDGVVVVENDYGKTVLGKGTKTKVKVKQPPAPPAGVEKKKMPKWQKKIKVAKAEVIPEPEEPEIEEASPSTP